MLMNRREISKRILKLLDYDADDIVKEIFNLAYEVDKEPDEDHEDDKTSVIKNIVNVLDEDIYSVTHIDYGCGSVQVKNLDTDKEFTITVS